MKNIYLKRKKKDVIIIFFVYFIIISLNFGPKLIIQLKNLSTPKEDRVTISTLNNLKLTSVNGIWVGLIKDNVITIPPGEATLYLKYRDSSYEVKGDQVFYYSEGDEVTLSVLNEKSKYYVINDYGLLEKKYLPHILFYSIVTFIFGCLLTPLFRDIKNVYYFKKEAEGENYGTISTIKNLNILEINGKKVNIPSLNLIPGSYILKINYYQLKNNMTKQAKIKDVHVNIRSGEKIEISYSIQDNTIFLHFNSNFDQINNL